MEELNTALATLIEQATTGIDASVSFLQAELPDVIYQLLMWHSVKSGVFFLLGIAILVVGVAIDYKLGTHLWSKYKDEKAYDRDGFWLGYGLAGTIPRCVVYIGGLTLLNLTWLKIWIAPKVWLIEYAAKLVS